MLKSAGYVPMALAGGWAFLYWLDSAPGDPAALLRVLKQQSPQTQLIVTSGSADSETIIGLINEARIYRFVNKPLNLSLLHAAMAAAPGGRFASMLGKT